MMKRTFIAIPVQAGPKLRETHTKLRNELKNEKIKWVDSDHFHVTIFFLGDTREEQIKQVDQMLAALVSKYSAFTIRLHGLGVFKNINKPRVLWAGIKDYDPMREIKKALDRQMQAIGFEPDKREFKPHLTLARIKRIDDRDKLQKLITKNEHEDWQGVDIDRLIYFESRLTQKGPLYKPIGQYRLNDSGK